MEKVPQITYATWVDDSDGCNGYRNAKLDTLASIIPTLLGLNEKEIKSCLGNPNRVELYDRGQKFFTYYSDCDSLQRTNQGLKIRFSAIGLASEFLVVQL